MAFEISVVSVGRLRPVVNPFKPLVHRFNRFLWQNVVVASDESFTTIYDYGRLSVHRVYDPEKQDPTEDMSFAAGIIAMFAYMFPIMVGAVGLVLLADATSILVETLGGVVGAFTTLGLIGVGSVVFLAAADIEYEVEISEEAATKTEVSE